MTAAVKMHGKVETKVVSGLEFADISAELYRTYTFEGGSTYTVQAPLWLNVSKSGGHRIIVADNSTIYIPGKYIAIQWFNKEGKGPVQF